MSEEIVIHLGQDAMKTLALLSAPLLLGTLVIGLIVSVFQALTQINEKYSDLCSQDDCGGDYSNFSRAMDAGYNEFLHYEFI